MNALQTFIGNHPFLRSTDVPELVRLSRLTQVLVRCGGCRFTCAAQDVEHLISCVSAGGDYVRDVSFPVGSMEMAATWQPERPLPIVAELPVFKSESNFCAECEQPEGDCDCVSVPVNHFNEADCGGVYDGFCVTSDADPGL